MIIQEEFRALVEETVSMCREYFGRKLIAVYLHGSINYGDAIPGVSDMDCCVVLGEIPCPEDKEWLCKSIDKLQKRFPAAEGIHITTYTVDNLRADKWTRFMLKYNASLYAGIDIVEMLDSESIDKLYPDLQIARARLGFARKCFEDALNGKQPACTGEIPQNTYYAARKFARYFVVIEGAYWLMSQNKFKSFAKEDVLSGLKENCKQFEDIFELTDSILRDPVDAGIGHVTYLKRIEPFVEWIFESISTGDAIA